jgi:hypothetical protein
MNASGGFGQEEFGQRGIDVSERVLAKTERWRPTARQGIPMARETIKEIQAQTQASSDMEGMIGGD